MDLTYIRLDRGSAAVYTPRSPIVIGRSELARWEASEPESSEFDLRMLDRVREKPEHYRALVFQGRDPEGGPGCYRIDASLRPDERDRVSFQIVRHTIPTFRALAALGVRGVYHVSWEPNDVSSMQRAKDRYISERAASPAARKLDSFILHRTVFFVFSDLERALDRFIPSAVASIERDSDTLERLIEEASAAQAEAEQSQ